MLKRTFTLLMGLLCSIAFWQAQAASLDLPETFDSLGPTVQSLSTDAGDTLYYIDTGEIGWQPVVFFGGGGTSVRVFALTEFLRSLRQQYQLRFISVERNGFGDTPYKEGWTYADYANEVETVLAHLNIDTFAAVAISGGGPYLTEVVAKLADRVTAVHLAAAVSQNQGANDAQSMQLMCSLPSEQLAAVLLDYTTQPKLWFGFDADSPIHKITGFQDQAYEDAARTFFNDGQIGDTSALTREVQSYCTRTLADVSQVTAPVYIYQGTADTSVPVAHAEFWQQYYPNVAQVRWYEGEGHDVQYRHWDQILTDIAGFSEYEMLCMRGKSHLVFNSLADLFQKMGATVGICAWAD